MLRFTSLWRTAAATIITSATLEDKLRGAATISPSRVTVKDISAGCGSFFHVEVVSGAFRGKPLVQQHRLVNEALRDEIKQIHGLTIVTKSSE
mmetsp:Transcript_28949/g.33442  ORF Transcript_28949/g.33442 Transcript_28949/m.33442 type:complete len:93 (+) Transcript_28949:43-321(+)